MKKIAISQRVEFIEAYKEYRDCLDQGWSALLSACDLLPVPMPNRIESFAQWADALGIEGFVLSGGNDPACLPEAINKSVTRDSTEKAALQYAQQNHLPLLGVCRGCLQLQIFAGGKVQKVKRHVAIKHQIIFTDLVESEIVEVNSFHNWGVTADNLVECFQPLALSDDGLIEAFEHFTLPWKGIMWHPEREFPFKEIDVKLIKELFYNHDKTC
jgi:putative glutamine amidotransferase